MKSLLAAFLPFLLVPSLLAQASTGAPAASEEIVVTASALPETVETTPASVTIVTKNDIHRQLASDLADTLREVPGLLVNRAGSAGKATSLFTRGANSNHTLVLWNGIELNNPYFSGFDWGRFSTAGVDRVEVVRGPFSALYGSEAVAGVINVIASPTRSYVSGVAESGGNGYRDGQLEAAWVGETLQIGGAFDERRDDGFAPNDDFRNRSTNAFAKWAPSADFSIALIGRHTSYETGVPFNNDVTGALLLPSPNRRGDGRETQFGVPLHQTIGRFGYDLTLSESRRADDFNDPDDPYGYVHSRTDSSVRRARLATHTVTSFGTIVVGGEYVRSAVTDVSNFGPNIDDSRRSERSLFAEDRLSHAMGSARLEVSIGVRYDHFDTFGTQTSPRIAVAWIGGANKLRAAYGEAFRAPSLGELYYPYVGNPALDAERGRSVEVGLDHSTAGGGIVSATLFASRYRDLIVFDPTTYTNGNVGRAKSDGLELGVQQPLSKTLYTAISYTYLRNDEDETKHQRLLRRPEHSGSLFVGWRRGNVDANVGVVRQGRRLDLLPVAPYTTTSNAAYTSVDANVQLHIGRIVPFVKVENVGNRRYEEALGYLSPSRRAIFGLRFGL